MGCLAFKLKNFNSDNGRLSAWFRRESIDVNHLIALMPLNWSKATLAFYCERYAVHERVFADSIESTG